MKVIALFVLIASLALASADANKAKEGNEFLDQLAKKLFNNTQLQQEGDDCPYEFGGNCQHYCVDYHADCCNRCNTCCWSSTPEGWVLRTPE